MTRTDIEVALDLRSYENLVVIASPSSNQSYPENWVRPARGDLTMIDEFSVVVIDRIEVQKKTLSTIGEMKPRILAMAPANVSQEKAMRTMISNVWPWAEVWTLSTDFGKLLVTNEAKGAAYDRDSLVDMRPTEEQS